MTPAPRKISIHGVPMDLGASKQGATGGPAAIRRAGLLRQLEALGVDAEDYGDIPVPARPAAKGPLRFAPAIRRVCEAVMRAVDGALEEGRLPVVLGGDHSLAMGSVAGSARYHARRGTAIGLLWVDAHADINTPASSPSGNIHGMPLAHLLGLGDKRLAAIGGREPKVRPQNICLVGIRDVDSGERQNLRDSGVQVFTMKEIDRHGMAHIVEQALEYALRGTAGVHLSFDIDAVDPAIAQGTGTPSRGGLTYRESHLLMELAADCGRIVSLDMVEVNPLEDVHNQTAGLASELIQSALGKRIF